MVRTLIEDVGLVLVALGVAMIYPPAGVIMAGVLLAVAANVHDGRRKQPVSPTGDAEGTAGQADPLVFGSASWPDS